MGVKNGVLPQLEQIDMRAIDWTERKPFTYKGETVYFNFEELLTAIRKPFRSVMFGCYREYLRHYADLWQMCSILCIRFYVGGAGFPYYSFCYKAFKREISQYLKRERKHEEHISLDTPIDEGENLTLGDSMFLAVHDKLLDYGLDWSAFTDEENEVIDCIFRHEPYVQRSLAFISLKHKLEQYKAGEEMRSVPFTVEEYKACKQAVYDKRYREKLKRENPKKFKRIEQLRRSKESKCQRKKRLARARVANLTIEQLEHRREKERQKWHRRKLKNASKTLEKLRERSRAWYARKKATATSQQNTSQSQTQTHSSLFCNQNTPTQTQPTQ